MTEREVRIKVVCTDRGRHRPRVFTTATLVDAGDGWDVVLYEAPGKTPWRMIGSGRKHRGSHSAYRGIGAGCFGQWHKPEESPDSRDGLFEFVCPRCGRHTEIRYDRMEQAWPALAEAGITQLDISRLPF